MGSITEKNMGNTERRERSVGSAEPIFIDHPVRECQG
jgi:hypothetical protein